MVLYLREYIRHSLWEKYILDLHADIHPYTDYGHTKAKSLILCGQNPNPNPK